VKNKIELPGRYSVRYKKKRAQSAWNTRCFVVSVKVSGEEVAVGSLPLLPKKHRQHMVYATHRWEVQMASGKTGLAHDLLYYQSPLSLQNDLNIPPLCGETTDRYYLLTVVRASLMIRSL